MCSCVYLAPAGSPPALCAHASALFWLPGVPEGFFVGICWQIDAAGLANCSFCGWHWPQRALNTKRWPRAFLSFFFLSPLCFPQTRTHKTMWHQRQNPEFQMGPAQGKSPKSSLKSGSEPNPQLRGDPIWVTARSGYRPSLYSSLPSLSLSISLSPFLPFFSLFLQLALSNFGQLFHTVKKKGGGEVALILPIMPQSVHLLCRSD